MLESIFGREKPIIGMIHLEKLSGQKGFRGLQYVTNAAIRNARALERGGVDGICIENWEDDSITPFIHPDMVRDIRYVVEKILERTHVSLGLNILPNDYRAAFSIAYEMPIDFIWLDIFVDRVRTDYSYGDQLPFEVAVDIADVDRYRARAPDTLVFASIHPKHYKLLEEGKTIEESARQAGDAGADAVVITKATGTAPDAETFSRVRRVVGDTFPTLLGSGLNVENASIFQPIADGAIVGTAFKDKSFRWVLESKVKNLITTWRG